MQVVEHHQHRTRPGEIGERPHHRIEEPEPVGLAARLRVLQQRRRVVEVGGRAEHLRPGPEGRRALGLAATSPHRREATVLGDLGDRGGEAALADARLAGEQHETAVARSDRGERRADPGQRAVPPDEPDATAGHVR
jgi:hypothetical protein